MDAADLAAQLAAGNPSRNPVNPTDPVNSTNPISPTDRLRRSASGPRSARAGTPSTPIPLEEYVARVLGGEAAPASGASALEALAITARTFALANRGRHRRDGFDLCTLTHCQVLRDPTPAMRAAVSATAGRVLEWKGAPASVFYTASCGGYTERPSAVWPGAEDPPFLPAHHDGACDGEPRWAAEIPCARPAAGAGLRRVSRHAARRVEGEGRTGSGPRRGAEAGGPVARRHRGHRLSDARWPRARLASDQEHRLHRASPIGRLLFRGARLRPRRRPVRARDPSAAPPAATRRATS